MNMNAFKAYDIRGQYPRDVNEDLAYKLGLAFVSEYNAKKVVVGRDIRESSPVLFSYLVSGILEAGCDVVYLGICGTEEVYFNTVKQEADGGIMITASHNPKDHNGFKLVRKGAEPISLDSGLLDLKARILQKDADIKSGALAQKGTLTEISDRSDYIDTLLAFVPQFLEEKPEPKRLRVVCNSGNGCAGIVLDLLEPHLPIDIVKIHHHPDGSFPNGVPNPLLFERRAATQQAVLAYDADFGVAWDGDFDRCFFFDEKGEFVDSSYIVGLLADELLQKNPGETIVIDTRQTLNSEQSVKNAGGEIVISAGGHSPMKRTMRQREALYGGEMSAHHYFQSFHYCDSGMIPFLLIASLLARSSQTLGDLVAEARALYPCSGELNYVVTHPEAVIESIDNYYRDQSLAKDYVDGLSIRLINARMNIRSSNTENYLRVNIEAERDDTIINILREELESIIAPFLVV